MRLRAINIFSAFIGDLEETRRRTGLLRKDSDFLYREYYNVVRYCDNDFLKQLNIECDENAEKIAVKHKLEDGYPIISVPFQFSSYQLLPAEEKESFWVEEIETVFRYVLPLMNCNSGKITDFINYLNKKYKH